MAFLSLLVIEEKLKRSGAVIHGYIGMRRGSGEMDVVIFLSISSRWFRHTPRHVHLGLWLTDLLALPGLGDGVRRASVLRLQLLILSRRGKQPLCHATGCAKLLLVNLSGTAMIEG